MAVAGTWPFRTTSRRSPSRRARPASAIRRLVDARRHAAVLRREDEQVAGQPGAGARPAALVQRRRDPPSTWSATTTARARRTTRPIWKRPPWPPRGCAERASVAEEIEPSRRPWRIPQPSTRWWPSTASASWRRWTTTWTRRPRCRSCTPWPRSASAKPIRRCAPRRGGWCASSAPASWACGWRRCPAWRRPAPSTRPSGVTPPQRPPEPAAAAEADDDELVPVSVRLGTVVPPEDPEDWTRPLTWVAAAGMLAAPLVALLWFWLFPPAETSAYTTSPGTILVASAVALGGVLTGATQQGGLRASTATVAAGLFAGLATVIVGLLLAGERQIDAASPTLAQAFGASAGRAGRARCGGAPGGPIRRRPGAGCRDWWGRAPRRGRQLAGGLLLFGRRWPPGSRRWPRRPWWRSPALRRPRGPRPAGRRPRARRPGRTAGGLRADSVRRPPGSADGSGSRTGFASDPASRRPGSRVAGAPMDRAPAPPSGGRGCTGARGGTGRSRVADLHDPAQVHDRDPIGVGGDRGQVMGDHQHRDAAARRPACAAGSGSPRGC